MSQIEDKEKKVNVIKHKIRFVGRMARIWKVEKQNRELVLSLKEMSPDGKIPPGTLIQGKQGLTDKLKVFMTMKDLDKSNEKWMSGRQKRYETVKMIRNLPLTNDSTKDEDTTF